MPRSRLDIRPDPELLTAIKGAQKSRTSLSHTARVLIREALQTRWRNTTRHVCTPPGTEGTFVWHLAASPYGEDPLRETVQALMDDNYELACKCFTLEASVATFRRRVDEYEAAARAAILT